MSITLAIDSPVLTIEEFSRRSGTTKRSIGTQMDRGQLPFIQHEPRGTRYVNMIALHKMADAANADKPWKH